MESGYLLRRTAAKNEHPPEFLVTCAQHFHVNCLLRVVWSAVPAVRRCTALHLRAPLVTFGVCASLDRRSTFSRSYAAPVLLFSVRSTRAFNGHGEARDARVGVVFRPFRSSRPRSAAAAWHHLGALTLRQRILFQHFSEASSLRLSNEVTVGPPASAGTSLG